MSLRSIRREMPNVGTNTEYVRWLVLAVYEILCYLIDRDGGDGERPNPPTFRG